MKRNQALHNNKFCKKGHSESNEGSRFFFLLNRDQNDKRPVSTDNGQKGVTLIELLVVIAIFVAVGGVFTSILSSVLRGNNRTKIQSAITQNGSYVINYLTNIILKSEKVIKVGGVTSPDCTASPNPDGTSILLRYDTERGSNIICNTGNGSITVEDGALDADDNFTVESSVIILDTDTAKLPLVKMSDCNFTCIQNQYSSPAININFTLMQTNTSTLSEFKYSSDFNTSVTLRNYRMR